VDDPQLLERELTGLTVLSSAQGDSWGNQGICRLHRQMLLPTMICNQYRPHACQTRVALRP
jgi:hypothetical protein